MVAAKLDDCVFFDEAERLAVVAEASLTVEKERTNDKDIDAEEKAVSEHTYI